jgi:hypothetical protein
VEKCWSNDSSDHHCRPSIFRKQKSRPEIQTEIPEQLVDTREEDTTNQKFDITTKPKTGTYNTLTFPSEAYSKNPNPLMGGLNFRTWVTVSSRASLDPGPPQHLADENIDQPKPKESMN